MGGQLKLFTNKVLPKYNGISLLGGQGRLPVIAFTVEWNTSKHELGH